MMKCCICREDMYSYRGNNAQPLKDGLCCDKCNIFKVIPVKLEQAKG